ncbi:MAG: phosphonate ABC transporter, permease protein PhnE [Haloquadratum sp. J07HQX50]|jgi:phosphonate ABC transporter, permease protein PhnE|nr:MAG: phosphonate ABC transporter, permease protein PhnE [Haloquadratum sp. J07HQX50]
MSLKSRSEWKRFEGRQKWIRILSSLSVLAALFIFWETMDVRVSYFADAPVHLYDLFSRMYPPDMSILPSLIGPTIETFHMSLLATGFAFIFSIPTAILAAENLSPNDVTYGFGKLIISTCRSVHDIIWALIFVLILGPGALAGILGMGMKSIGFIGKFFAEEIEEIDRNTTKAVRATGANSALIMIYGIVPQIKAAFVGLTVYRWDVNIRAATIVGLVGAGGIGVQLDQAMGFLYWGEVLTILIVIFVLVVISEVVSAYLREKTR